jgi:hypothetical protein
MKLSMSIASLAVLAMPAVTALTALEEMWRVGPFAVTDQTLRLEYGSIGDTIEPVIEFFARQAGPATGEETIEVNCFGESGEKIQGDPAGFGVVKSKSDGLTELAITFNRGSTADADSIEKFVGYNGSNPSAPTVEFCVKVTLDGKIFRGLAVKYTFTLDGSITIDNAVVFNEDGTSEVILKTVEYGIKAYLCDADSVEKTAIQEVVTGESIYICLESDNTQASVPNRL